MHVLTDTSQFILIFFVFAISLEVALGHRWYVKKPARAERGRKSDAKSAEGSKSEV